MSFAHARRDILKCLLASAVVMPALSPADASTAELPLLDPADPVAQSLGFVLDASKAATKTNPTITPGQHCGVCIQYQGKGSDVAAGCSIYAGHSVPSRGWC